MRKRLTSLLVATMFVSISTLVPGQPEAAAFSGYTHASVSDEVWSDASDGELTILGRTYKLRDELLQVFADPSNRAYWNAGAIGPDGFPDIFTGQMSIHPYPSRNGGTGIWLGHLLDRAWRAQTDTSYSARERQQILAFTYGFLSHASSDVWAHTLVNELAQGPFPSWVEAIESATNGDVDQLSIIARHLFTEGYITDATPGFDGTGGAGAVRLYEGTWTDDTSPAIPLNIPTRWVYNSMILDPPALAEPEASTPARSMFSELRRAVRALPQKTVCITWGCAPAQRVLAILGRPHYFEEWLADIDRAEAEYPRLSLAIAQGLFDPGTKRAAQNEECATAPEWNRTSCVAGVGRVGAAKYAAHSYLVDDLLPALLGPLGKDVYELTKPLKDWILEEVNRVLAAVYPWLEASGLPARYEALTQWVEEFALDVASEALGLNLRDLAALLESPSSKMDLTTENLTLHPVDKDPLPLNLALFEGGDHAKLDGYLGLPTQHATAPGGGLADSVEYDPSTVAVYENAVTMSKLALLAGTELDRLLTDLIPAKKPYVLYGGQSSANIMTTVLPGANRQQPFQWLLSLDGDHAWRDGSLLPAGSKDLTLNVSSPLDAAGRTWVGAGAGNFPLYESCVLRSTFSTLFTDWEQRTVERAKAERIGEAGPVGAFAALGDGTSQDPNDPQPPSLQIAPSSGASASDAATIVNKGRDTIAVHATDDYWKDSSIQVEARWIPTGSSAEIPFTSAENHSRLTLPEAEGTYLLEARAVDPCHPGEVAFLVVEVENSFSWFPVLIVLLLGAVVGVLLILRRRRATRGA